jgi:hypothetical protein
MFLLIGVLAVLAMFAGPGAAYFELVPAMIGFGIFAGSALLGLAAVVGGLVAWRRSRRRHEPGSGRELRAVILGLVPLLVVGVPFGKLASEGHPQLNDVSTDRVLPPTSDQLSRPYPEKVARLVAAHHPGVQSLDTSLSAEELYTLAVKVAERQEAWKVTGVGNSTFAGVATSRLFKFKDDFVVRITATDSGAVLDIRSASRDGRNDFGANARRIKKYLADLRTEIDPPERL